MISSHTRVATHTRRTLLRVLGGSGVAALLAACAQPIAPQAPTTPTAPASPGGAQQTSVVVTAQPAAGSAQPGATQAAGGQPRAGGTLRVGLGLDLQDLDADRSGINDTLRGVFDALVVEIGSEEMRPQLAESWDWSTDQKTMQWHLRKGVQFHTGRELTSDDVKWNFMRIKDPKVGGGVLGGITQPLTSIETPDKYTVIMKSDAPWTYINHPCQIVPIIDPETMQGPDANKKAVGTGPFMFGEWVQGDHLTLVKNPNYWKSGLPYLDQVTYRILPDPQALVTSLEGGALDVAINPSLRDTVRYQASPDYQVIVNDLAGDYFILLVNCTRAPGDNKLVRQALNYALDRQRIASTVMLGLGRPSDLPFNPKNVAFDEAKNQFYTFDLDKARALLGQAGVSNLDVDLNYNAAIAEWANLGQIYKADLAQIGVNLNLKPTDAVSVTSMSVAQSYSGLISGGSTFGRVPAPTPFYNPQTNWSGFHSDTLNQLAVAYSTEPDPGKAKAAIAAWTDYALDQSWAIPVVSTLPRAVMHPNVHGLYYTMNESLIAAAAWLA